MKYLKVAGLCLVSVLVASMVWVGNAAAQPLLWLLCLKTGTSGSTPTKYTTNQCTTAAVANNGEWQSVGLGANGSDTIKILFFSLALIDKGVGISVHCPDAGTGWDLVRPASKLETKVAEFPNPVAEGCKLEGSFLTCKETANLTKIAGVNLPWKSEIFETEDKYLSDVTSASGKPGWAITCGGATDTCTESTEKPELALASQGVTKGILLVLLEFEDKGRANCTIGGNGKGELEGLEALLLWNGNGLSLTTL